MRILTLLTLPFLLSGCFFAAATATVEGGKAIADERTLGEQMDDATIYTAINRYFVETDSKDLSVNVTVNVRRGRVLLTGNVDKEETVRRATEQAWRARGVQEVINEVKVKPGQGFWNNASDALIKKNIESRLLVTKDVWVVNYSLDVIDGTTYLIGTCENQGELDRVLAVVRTTKGVKQVVSYLKLATDTPAPANSYGAPPANYTPMPAAQSPASGNFSPEPMGSVPSPSPVSSSDLPPPAK